MGERSRKRRGPVRRLLRRLRHLSRSARGAVRERALRGLASLWRRLMLRTTVVAVTGSVGKTTGKECLAAALSARGRTLKTRNNENDLHGVPRTLLALRPWHRYAVVEVGVGGPGEMEPLARMVRPDVAVVLSVARTHTHDFRTLEATAAEKAKLLGHLRRRGTAILNADDPHVRAMAEGCPRRVLWFGSAPDCDWVVREVASAWPGRLSFSVSAAGVTTRVETRLVGRHWVGSALAALAAAAACGVPLAEAARRIGGVRPFAGRMQPLVRPGGAIVVRDEENGSPDTLNAMLEVLREARAKRRVLVVSDVSDSRARPRRRQQYLGRAAAALADLAIFTDSHGHHAVDAAVAAGMDPSRCRHVPDLAKLADLLRSELREGDLVFVKGRSTDHLTRALLAQYGPIGCWRTSCGIHRICDACPLLEPGFDLARVLAEHAAPAPDSGAGAWHRRSGRGSLE